MSQRSTTPWVSIVLGALLMLNPIGLAFIGQAMSGDPLSRGIATPFVVIGLVILLIVLGIEMAIRWRPKPPTDAG
jgi:hydrogenase/urease accessory protein HupE